MAETTESKRRTERAKGKAKSVKIERGAIDTGTAVVEGLEGFTPEEVARLVEARQKIASGTYTDVTPEHRKLLFVQWLIEHERIKS